MPHLFTPGRPREYLLASLCPVRNGGVHGDPLRAAQAIIEYFHSTMYIFGGVLLILGSIFFVPSLSGKYPRVGTSFFIAASLIYFYVSAHDVLEVIKFHKQELRDSVGQTSSNQLKSNNAPTQTQDERQDELAQAEMKKDDLHRWYLRLVHAQKQIHVQEFVASMAYAAGAALFVVGSVLFLPDVENAEKNNLALVAGWCFVVGSFLFLLGAFYNVLLIWYSPDRSSMQLANLIANSYVMGSAFYLCASLPYLYTSFACSIDEFVILSGCAGVYVAGSALFALGGVLDLQRTAYIRHIVKAKIQNDQRLHRNGLHSNAGQSSSALKLHGNDDCRATGIPEKLPPLNPTSLPPQDQELVAQQEIAQQHFGLFSSLKDEPTGGDCRRSL